MLGYDVIKIIKLWCNIEIGSQEEIRSHNYEIFFSERYKAVREATDWYFSAEK